MSEHAPEASTPAPEAAPETPSTEQQSGSEPVIDQAAEQLDAATNPDTQRSPELDAMAETINSALGNNPQLNHQIEENAGWKIRSMNRLDRAQRSARLLSAREHRLEGRVGKLEAQLAGLKPGSRKHMRISERLTTAKWRKRNVEISQEKSFGRIRERGGNHVPQQEMLKKIEEAREDRLIKRKVAVEKKRRRAIENKYQKELKQTDPSLRQQARKNFINDPGRRERLRKELSRWKNPDTGADVKDNTIVDFQENLVKEARAQFKTRVARSSH